MAEVGIYEAKTKFAKLVQRAERGEEITITRHGHPVAKLIAASIVEADIRKTIDAIHGFKAKHGVKGFSRDEIKALIEDGRRR